MFDLTVWICVLQACITAEDEVRVLHCDVVDSAQMATWIQLVRFAAVAR